MAITTYAELQAAVANWLVRGDLTARAPEFIALFEAWANRDLRVRDMEKRATSSPVSEYGTLPTDFVEEISFVMTEGDERWEIEAAPQVVIDAADVQTGRPRNYAIVGGQFRFFPSPDKAYGAILTYYGQIPALSDAATSNWLLAKAPDAYLFGALAEAGPFLRDPDVTAAYELKRDRAIAAVKKAARPAVGKLRTEFPGLIRGRAYDIRYDL